MSVWTHVQVWFWFTFLVGLVEIGLRIVTYDSVSGYSKMQYVFGNGELFVVAVILAANALERLVRRMIVSGSYPYGPVRRELIVFFLGGNVVLIILSTIWFVWSSVSSPSRVPSDAVMSASLRMCGLAALVAGATVPVSSVRVAPNLEL
jgi:hypothetical protein